MRFRTTCRALALVALNTSLGTSAFGQTVDDGTRNAARSLASQGKDAFDQADWEHARDLFHRAYTLVPAPTIALYEGRALSKLRRFVEAEEAYMRAARTNLDAESPEPFRKAVHDAEDDLLALRAKMPKVTIVTAGPGARELDLSVTLDGRALKSALLGVELPIDPGEHTLRAVVPGATPVQVAFSVAEKQTQTVELTVPLAQRAPLEAQPQPQPAVTAPQRVAPQPQGKSPSWHLPAALVAGGAGVAGVATGIFAGLMAGSRYSKAERQCPDHACVAGSAGVDTLQSFRTLRTVSTIGYIVGGVGVAAGTTLFLTAPSKSTATARSGSVDVWVNLGAVGLTGAF